MRCLYYWMDVCGSRPGKIQANLACGH